MREKETYFNHVQRNKNRERENKNIFEKQYLIKTALAAACHLNIPRLYPAPIDPV